MLITISKLEAISKLEELARQAFKSKIQPLKHIVLMLFCPCCRFLYLNNILRILPEQHRFFSHSQLLNPGSSADRLKLGEAHCRSCDRFDISAICSLSRFLNAMSGIVCT